MIDLTEGAGGNFIQALIMPFVNFARHPRKASAIGDLPMFYLAGMWDMIDWTKVPAHFSEQYISTSKDLVRTEGLIRESTKAHHRTHYGSHDELTFTLEVAERQLVYCSSLTDAASILHAETARRKEELIEVGGLSDGHVLQLAYFRHGDYEEAEQYIARNSKLALPARITLEQYLKSQDSH